MIGQCKSFSMGNILPPFPELPRSDCEGPVKNFVGIAGVLFFPSLELDLSSFKVHSLARFLAVLETAVPVLVGIVGQ